MSDDLNTQVKVMANDINYIKEELKDIKEFMRIVVDQKADRKEVEELKANQTKVAWIIITFVLVAILGLLVKTQI
jgi:hypothetical protein